MGIFSGFGRGVAAAALGAQTGEIKGEAEGYRRQQADLARQLRLAQIAANQKVPKDPLDATRKIAGAYLLQLGKTRDDLENTGFFKDHPELRAGYDDKLSYLAGVASGSLPADNFDPVHFGQVAQHATDIAGDYQSPYGQVVKSPTGQAQLPGEEPYAIGSATGPYAPSLAPPVQQRVLPPPTLGDTSQKPVTSYVTPKQAVAATTAGAAKQNADTNTARSASEIPLTNARTEGVKITNRTLDRKNVAGIHRTEAGTRQANEAVRSSQVLTPIKAAESKARIGHMAAGEQQARNNLASLDKQRKIQNSQAAERIRIAKDNLASNEAYRKAKLDEINLRIKNLPNTEAGKNDRAALGFYARILAGRENIGPLGSILGADQAPMAVVGAQAILDRYTKAPAGSTTTTSVGYQGQAKNAPAALGGPKVSPAELNHVGGIIKSGGFDAWMASPALKDPALRQKAKAAYAKITKRTWAGK